MGTAMPEFTAGVSFNHVAREWRCKWDPESPEKKVLGELQAAVDVEAIKAVAGVVSVQRVICGGCYDWKLIIKLTEPEFGPAIAEEGLIGNLEAAFMEKIKAIEGVSTIETQN